MMSGPSQDVVPPHRVTIVLDHPAQHFADGFSLLSKEPDLDVEVMYWDTREGGYSDVSFGRDITWDVDLTSTYPHWSPPARLTLGRMLQCVRRLLARKPEVLVCYGWATPIARVAILVATALRLPVLFYGDSTWQHSTRPHLGRLRKIVLRWLFSRPSSAALSTGAFNRDFYLVNGMTPDKVHHGVCPVDTRAFVVAAESAAVEGSTARGDHHAVSIAFAGKFVDRKAPSHLIKAAALLADAPDWHVTMIGDGPLRGQLERLVEKVGLGHKVTFSGFKNASKMPRMLAAVDILVIPSIRDMRILVATEAMATGAVPVVSSATAVWGAGDLVEPGKTGLVYPAGDVDALSDALATLINDSHLRARLSSCARERALDHDSDDFARLAGAAVRAMVAMERPRYRKMP